MIVLTEKERIMKIKILIALSLIALIVGYSCQEDLGLAPIEQDVGTVGLSVGKLNAESARFLFAKMNYLLGNEKKIVMTQTARRNIQMVCLVRILFYVNMIVVLTTDMNIHITTT